MTTTNSDRDASADRGRRRVAEKETEYVKDVREEIDHMPTLVSELLSFSKAEIGAVWNCLQLMSQTQSHGYWNARSQEVSK